MNRKGAKKPLHIIDKMEKCRALLQLRCSRSWGCGDCFFDRFSIIMESAGNDE